MKNRVRFFVVLCFVFFAIKAQSSILIIYTENLDENLFYCPYQFPIVHTIALRQPPFFLKEKNNLFTVNLNDPTVVSHIKIGEALMATTGSGTGTRLI